jgi:hypothetical protein
VQVTPDEWFRPAVLHITEPVCFVIVLACQSVLVPSTAGLDSLEHCENVRLGGHHVHDGPPPSPLAADSRVGVP